MAGLVRAGWPALEAVASWHLEAPADSCHALQRVARAVRMGAPPGPAVRALVPGADARHLAALLDLHARAGGDLALMLHRLAEWMRTRDEMERSTAAGTAGVRLSGRMIAWLPLAATPFLPYKSMLAGNRTAVVLVITGMGLLLGGLRWMKALLPLQPADDDAAALLCEMAASLLGGGVALDDALGFAASCELPGLADELAAIRRRVALGMSWGRAFVSSTHPSIRDAGYVVRNTLVTGTDPATALLHLAEERRRATQISYEERAKKAAVRMILPLTLLILPAFLMLGVVPFVADLAQL